MTNLLLGMGLGLLIALVIRRTFLAHLIDSLASGLFGSTEFFDQQELLLNYKKNSSWANLGYWSSTSDYSVAAQNLAELLGEQCQLKSGDHIFDIGFGNGDQLQLWRQKFSAAKVDGFNISKSQLGFAKQHFSDDEVQLHLGSYQMMKDCGKADAIVALDCAYHFSSRKEFLEEAASALSPNGRLGLVDLAVNSAKGSFWDRIFLYLIAFGSKIPFENLWSAERFKDSLEDAGFSEISWTDISDQVFLPFDAFVQSMYIDLKDFAKPQLFYKYRITAWALKRLYGRGLLEMVVIGARKG